MTTKISDSWTDEDYETDKLRFKITYSKKVIYRGIIEANSAKEALELLDGEFVVFDEEEIENTNIVELISFEKEEDLETNKLFKF